MAITLRGYNSLATGNSRNDLHTSTVGDPTSVRNPALPAGSAEDDLVFVLVVHDSSETTTIACSGWTAVGSQAEYGTNLKAQLFYKVIGASESAPSVTVSQTTADGVFMAGCVGFYNVDPVTPLDGVTPQISGGSTTTTMTAPDITTSTDGAGVVRFWGQTCSVNGTHTVSTSNGDTVIVDGTGWLTTVSTDAIASAGWRILASAGSAGTTDSTAFDDYAYASYSVVMRDGASFAYDETLRPNAVSLTNLAGPSSPNDHLDIDDDPDSPDSNWLEVS